MNRLALVPCLVVASYVAVASYIASPIVYELGRSSVGFKIPTTVSTYGQTYKGSSSRTKQTSSVHPSNEVPTPAITEKPAASFCPKRLTMSRLGSRCCSPRGFMTVPLLKLQSSAFMRLEHRSASQAIGKTGLKSSNRALRNPGGSIENT